MKKCHIFLLLLLLSVAIYSFNIKSLAEDNCSKYHLGICIVPAPTNNNATSLNSIPQLQNNTSTASGNKNNLNNSSVKTNEQKCKTMVDGLCTEYYSSATFSNSIQQEIKQDMHVLNKKEQNKVCNNAFGLEYILDPYANVWSTWEVYNQSKVFIIYVAPNSPAEKAGLKVGDEIIRINGNRVVKFKGSDFDNYLTNQNTIKLDIKSVNNGKKSIVLSKELICLSVETEPFFDSYWEQVCDYNIGYVSDYLSAISTVTNKLTPQLKSEYNIEQNRLNWWNGKKAQFRNGFNLCLSNNYNKADVNNCLANLVSRTLNIIAHEQNVETQRAAIHAQQQQAQAQLQVQQQQVNALNNYSNALRNQRMDVNVSGNIGVEHSGTVNVNKNVYGTMYHRW